jgi:hypothetical protein
VTLAEKMWGMSSILLPLAPGARCRISRVEWMPSDAMLSSVFEYV